MTVPPNYPNFDPIQQLSALGICSSERGPVKQLNRKSHMYWHIEPDVIGPDRTFSRKTMTAPQLLRCGISGQDHCR